jgi:protein TonB
MEPNKILKADVLDIIFDNRNKSYGAYELRKNYHKRIRNALFIALTGVFVVVSIPLLASLNETNATHTKPPIIVFKDIPLPIDPVVKIEPPIETPPVKPIDVSTVKSVTPIIVPNEKADDKDLMKDQDELKKGNIGTTDHDGSDDVTDVIDVPIGHGHGGETIVETTPNLETILETTVVDQLPEFPGGEDELIKFLTENMNYPELAREKGTEGRVVIGFVVNKEGEIDVLKLKRGIGDGCDKEAIRVVNKMPKWKPAKFNGKTVSVYFDLPIQFDLEDDK